MPFAVARNTLSSLSSMKGDYMQPSATGLLERILSKMGLFKPSVQEERRRSKRYRLNLPIRFRICHSSDPDQSSPFLNARMYDLSELGVGLLTTTLHHNGFHMMHPTREVAETCRLEIEIPHGVNQLKLYGKAVWYMPNPAGHPYAFRIGVQFIELTPDLNKGIQTLVHLYHADTGVS